MKRPDQTWLIDDGPFGLLARVLDHRWDWPASTLHMARAVADGGARDKSGRRQQLLSRQNSGQPWIRVHGIQPGTPAAGMLYNHLRHNRYQSTEHLGEHASIALAATTLPTAVFVTMDKGAAFLALAELGRDRVATPYELWNWLCAEGFITMDCRLELLRLTSAALARL